MKQRMNYAQEYPEAYQAMLGLEQFVKQSGLSTTLLELVKLRASQINGCAFCLNMHARDARKYGETEQRIYLLNAWREAPIYSPSERAALALTEAVTRIAEGGVPQEIYDEAAYHFNGKELTALLMAINAINCWNRLAVATGMIPD
ncbi:carboxymuconolactone decarboxylase family protein [Paenibacillus hexagrammi]|uniref:Carboxymuconolactone decarboxylase family protein n=1 Tax=Paenibacillus hexagrammi TaxID=2908839 RepID=A0ABY3SPH1_9BACL|nr:carboxymuconolactone decarboxylase family protein [Paenibacillus sp. YPD9-1]UJF35864.1 carboxymuconolactone decarboxylase family protein [Paenibacillus sp. YPD9-1]